MTHQEFSSTTSNSTTTTNSISRSYMSTSGEAATTARIVAAPSSNQLSHLEGEEDEEKKDSVFPKASCPEYNEEDEVEKARVAREQAEEEAYQKLVDAVCKASLLEFNEREKAFQQYEASLVNDALQRQESQRKVEEAKYKADLSKRQAVQHILESKIIAKQKSEQAKIALEMYEQKQFEVIEKKMLLENKKQEKKQQEELEKLKQKQQEAMKKRLFAEQKAQEAIEKAKQMREKAVQAVQNVREKSRNQIDFELTKEEEKRQVLFQEKKNFIEQKKLEATLKKLEANQKAEKAFEKAKKLQEKAQKALETSKKLQEKNITNNP